jgi:hypothetical protein
MPQPLRSVGIKGRPVASKADPLAISEDAGQLLESDANRAIS